MSQGDVSVNSLSATREAIKAVDETLPDPSCLVGVKLSTWKAVVYYLERMGIVSVLAGLIAGMYFIEMPRREAEHKETTQVIGKSIDKLSESMDRNGTATRDALNKVSETNKELQYELRAIRDRAKSN